MAKTGTARYRRRCDICIGWIEKGDAVVYDRVHAWVHPECPAWIREKEKEAKDAQ